MTVTWMCNGLLCQLLGGRAPLPPPWPEEKASGSINTLGAFCNSRLCVIFKLVHETQEWDEAALGPEGVPPRAACLRGSFFGGTVAIHSGDRGREAGPRGHAGLQGMFTRQLTMSGTRGPHLGCRTF